MRDDLDHNEIQRRLRSQQPATVEFQVRLQDELRKIAVSVGSSGPDAIVRVPILLKAASTGVLWLQAQAETMLSSPVIAVPLAGSYFSFDATHALVSVASGSGGFCEARLYSGADGDPASVWTATSRNGSYTPIVGSMDGAIWATGPQVEPTSSPVAWHLTTIPEPQTELCSKEWWMRFDNLVRAASTATAELEDHLRALTPADRPWRIGSLAVAAHAQFITPVESGLSLALVPAPTEVIVAVDLHLLTPDVLGSVLLHAVAHLALGHVLPGDEWGHWDTLQTATTREPHRQWDRDARDYLATRLARPTTRHIESIEDCTPKEKAELGLWRMIGEMLGESRRLHPAAERYQNAAYQRQAASRMLAMFEEYGGAMLCDGVGLGKTYIATTLMVHYANRWRDQWAPTPERLIEDPFRITVLSPNSVVSTWRREALPPLASFGVPLATVRVISHTKLSRISRESELIETVRGGMSDLEHLLLSDLVIVDEAHNFRSLAARRTKVLRDLLRVQPRREARRRVALLTATPVNNSLEDLRQELSRCSPRPLWLSDARTDDGYRRQALKDVHDRCARARRVRSKGDVAALAILGDPDEKFKDAIEFRDDLDFGPNVQRIGDYLREQDKKLKELQEQIRSAAQNGGRDGPVAPVRIAEDLLDRIVVQRSRSLCKEIERQQASNVELLFRADASPPEKLHYADEYDGIEDVLARFLPLFDGDAEKHRAAGTSRLSLKVYMWFDVREGVKRADETSSVVGLQRVLVLKRLESSPVSFLITLLRLAVLHAHRLQQLGVFCLAAGDFARHGDPAKQRSMPSSCNKRAETSRRSEASPPVR